jgi:hypothetical protein
MARAERANVKSIDMDRLVMGSLMYGENIHFAGQNQVINL